MMRFWKKLWRRGRLERELAEELAFHKQMAAEGGNATPLGRETAIAEGVYDSWRFNAMENLWRDARYAARGLWRSKAFTLSALLSLGLGVGVNTTIFSLAKEFLLSEPSLRQPDRVVNIRVNGNSHAERETLEAFAGSGAFAGVTGETAQPAINYDDGQQTRRLFTQQGAKNYFDVLGVPLAMGRGWSESDPDEVVVVSDHFWRREMRGDAAAVGQVLRLDGKPYTVIGVLPRAHRSLTGSGYSPDVYVPVFVSGAPLMMYVRLKEGMNVGEARAAAATLSRHLREREAGPRGVEYPAQVRVLGGVERLGQDRKAMTVVVFFGILMALVGLVLLIACVNVAGMLLARASARRQEIAIRLSLGASRGRLLQQLLAESALLAGLGTAAGLGMAYAVARAVSGMALPMPVPIRVEVTPDGQVLAYALMLAVVATVASGLAPAWQAVKESVAPDLAREKKLRLRRVLVVAQVAVSFVVLVTGALFLRSLAESANMSPGFDVAPMLRAEAHLPPAEYAQPGRMEAYGERVVNELRALPGVEAAAVVRTVPFNDQSTQGGRIRLADTGESIPVRVHTNAVTPEYFRVMGIRLLAGRGLTERVIARPDGAGERVVVVNRVFAERYLRGRQAVGTSFLWGSRRFQVVGVVEGTKVMTMGEDPQPQMYEPFRQESWAGTRMDFVVRSATPPEGQLRVVQETLRRLEPGAGLLVATMANSMGLALLPAQVGALLMGSVGAVGLLLAAIGLYGVLAYMVVRRTREIGVRMAVGATAWQIGRMVVADAGRLVAVGSAIGLGVAVLVTEPLAMFLVPGLSPRDPLSIAGVGVVLAASTALAAAGPLRRAARVDPMAALRCE